MWIPARVLCGLLTILLLAACTEAPAGTEMPEIETSAPLCR